MLQSLPISVVDRRCHLLLTREGVREIRVWESGDRSGRLRSPDLSASWQKIIGAAVVGCLQRLMNVATVLTPVTT